MAVGLADSPWRRPLAFKRAKRSALKQCRVGSLKSGGGDTAPPRSPNNSASASAAGPAGVRGHAARLRKGPAAGQYVVSSTGVKVPLTPWITPSSEFVTLRHQQDGRPAPAAPLALEDKPAETPEKPGPSSRRRKGSAAGRPSALADKATKTPRRQGRACVPVTPPKPPAPESHTAFQEEGLGVIVLEEADAAGAAGDGGSTREDLLAKDHMLLPEDVVGRALELCGQMVHLAAVWTSDEDDLSGELWEVYLQPAAGRAVAFAKRGQFAGALAELLGVVLFTGRHDAWLRKPEVGWQTFQAFFEDVAAAWTLVLAQSDSVLGLAPPSGKPGGYRPRLRALLRAWQDRASRALEGEAAGKGPRGGSEAAEDPVDLTGP